jgi:hypothetical protein
MLSQEMLLLQIRRTNQKYRENPKFILIHRPAFGSFSRRPSRDEAVGIVAPA